MAGSKSDFLENELLDHVYGNAAYSPPATVYVALFTVAPSDAGGGTECTGGSYERKAVTNNATNWPAAVGGVKSNGVAITFVTPTGSWGTVVAFGTLDALAAGNLLNWGDLTTPQAIGTGNTVRFDVGALPE